MKVGDLEASIPLDSLSNELGIESDSDDGKLLEVVIKSLRFVKDIRPADTIPREILDGTASWSVEDRHREIARNRLMAQIAFWLTGDEDVITDHSELQDIVNGPDMKDRINKGVEGIAERLGMGKGRRQEVIDLIERLARELAYIEALRESFMRAHAIQSKLATVQVMYRGDRQFTDEVQRAKILIEKPINDFSLLFDQVDGQTGEILTLLKSYDQQITFICEMRDELHQNLMIWEEIIEQWDINLNERSKQARAVVQSTYRFVASNFPQVQDWF